jgi:hypothetical protein
MDNSKLYEFDQNNLVRTPAKFTASSWHKYPYKG